MNLKSITTEGGGNIFSLPYVVARDEGYFAEEGLEVEFVQPSWQRKGDILNLDDPQLVDAIGGHSIFETGDVSLYRACEWGQVRRSHDSERGGRIISKRAAVASQAIFVRPDSPFTHPQDLRNRTVAVNFHHGSHYAALQTLEGFLSREEIKLVHVGGPRERFEALRDGLFDAAALMEPWISAAEKLGYKLLAEAFYVGSEIASPDLDADTFAAINRAVSKGVRKLNTDPRRYLHYLIDDVPPEIVQLTPEDFRLSRLRYVEPAPYPREEFQKTYDWMVGWGLISPDASYDELVDNRVAGGAA